MENEKVHGNSKKSKKKQHLYKIEDETIKNIDDKTYKYGISGSKLNKNGSSKRANVQVNKFNRDSGWKRFIAFVLKKNIEGRAKALELEQEITEKYQDKYDRMPDGQIKPDKNKTTNK